MCCRIIFRVYEHSCEAALRLPFARVVTGQPAIWKILFYYVFLFAAVLLLRKKEETKGRNEAERGGLSFGFACEYRDDNFIIYNTSKR